MTSKGWQCCRVNTVFGFNLSKGVYFVGISTLMISIVAMTSSIVTLNYMSDENHLNMKPTQAINLIFSLFCSSMSAYQIVISILLILAKNSFRCSLWFVSHVSILFFYTILFTARAVIGFATQQYSMMIFTLIAAVIYSGVFIYFMIVIQSYIWALKDQDLIHHFTIPHFV